MPRIHHIRNLREEVLEIFRASPLSLLILDISKRLGIRSDSDEYEHLRQILDKLTNEGLLVKLPRRRFALAENQFSGHVGILKMYHDSATVRSADASATIIHIRREHLHTAFDGDTVLVQPHAVRAGHKLRGEVVKVVERTTHIVTGTLHFDGSFFFLIPDDPKYYVDFLVNSKNLKGAKHSDKVIGRLLRWEQANASPEAVIEEVLGRSGRPVVEFAAIYKEFRLPKAFPQEVVDESTMCQVPGAMEPGRVSLVDDVVVTIDPDDAKDFDDALSLKLLSNGNWELGVHIADVSHYVTEGSALDKEALKRANSTYLVDGVVPMLPERLSNNICSLVPNEIRLTFSVFMEFTKRGGRKSYRIEETVIRSKRRFTYDEVQTIIDTNKGDHAELILNLHTLARALQAERMRHGGISFETQEIKFILDENKMPVQALVKAATLATSLVEECMLAANRAVAEHFEALKKLWRVKEPPPIVYRIHEDPDQSKLTDALSVIRAIGIDAPSGKLNPAQINNILKQASNLPQKPMVHQMLLRSMAKAAYAEHNVGHYGLGFHAYTHFTSPIRRYPDLFVHRALKEYAKGQPRESRWKDMLSRASEVADHSSLMERQAIDAERASSKLAQVILAREHMGETFEGTVTGVTAFGVFLLLDSVMCEGLLHIRDLADDYYIFDERTYRLIGKRKKRIIQFGTRIKAQIVKANVERRMIDLALNVE
ncbi:MAG: ribonuclease R [Ignavibacteria bacterium]|nr:ribonuclease R [Ignavibacteria bacterium]